MTLFIVKLRRAAALFSAATAILIGFGQPARADAFPEKPLVWIVGFPPGGTADVVTRVVAERMGKNLGQPIVIDNKPGATSLLALQAAARAAPDGYTMITVTGPFLSSRPMPQVGRELDAVGMLARGSLVLVTAASAPAPSTLKDLVEDARKHPRLYSFASAGNGTAQHLLGEMLNQAANLKMIHVPYKGGSQAIVDVISGNVKLGFLGLAAVLPQIKAGKLKPYAVTSSSRLRDLPDVPTFVEAGYPSLQASSWMLAAVPRGVPSARVQRLSAALAQARSDPITLKEFAELGVSADFEDPQKTARFVASDLKRWQELAAQKNLVLQ
jgi:tripartite-type tricarboxylate transporter receptor subunit TctC